MQLALQLAWQLSVQLLLHVVEPGFAVHMVVQSLPQLVVQLASAVILHMELHVCSSFAAQHCSKFWDVHCVVHAVELTTSHCAPGRMSMLPHAEIPA
jgi:hypothetical protein